MLRENSHIFFFSRALKFVHSSSLYWEFSRIFRSKLKSSPLRGIYMLNLRLYIYFNSNFTTQCFCNPPCFSTTLQGISKHFGHIKEKASPSHASYRTNVAVSPNLLTPCNEAVKRNTCSGNKCTSSYNFDKY